MGHLYQPKLRIRGFRESVRRGYVQDEERVGDPSKLHVAVGEREF